MQLRKLVCTAAAATLMASGIANADTLTIATVNNGDMIRMQGLTDDFTAKTGHKVEWVTLEENVLRQRVTTDITTKGGAFDIMTIGMYETPIWGKNGWLVPLDDLSAGYNVGDILPAMAGGLSHDGTLYATASAFVARPAGVKAALSLRPCQTRSARAGSMRTGMRSSTHASGPTR